MVYINSKHTVICMDYWIIIDIIYIINPHSQVEIESYEYIRILLCSASQSALDKKTDGLLGDLIPELDWGINLCC